MDEIERITDKHAPLKTLTQRETKLYFKPWITTGILKSIRTKQKMYKTHFLSNKTHKKDEYRKYCNSLNKLKKKSKEDYFTKRFEQLKGNLKCTWKLIGTLIKRNSKGQHLLKTLKRNYNVYTDSLDIANQLNNHFINMGPKFYINMPEFHAISMYFLDINLIFRDCLYFPNVYHFSEF